MALANCRYGRPRSKILTIRQPPKRFLTAENYHIAATLMAFLLEEKDRELRPRVIDLAEAVHSYHADAAAQARCFEGLDMDALDKEFRAYVAALVIDPE